MRETVLSAVESAIAEELTATAEEASALSEEASAFALTPRDKGSKIIIKHISAVNPLKYSIYAPLVFLEFYKIPIDIIAIVRYHYRIITISTSY